MRAETIAAESVLHDMGLISIISSDSQAMGRGEVLAGDPDGRHHEEGRGKLPRTHPPTTTSAVLRFSPKVTINPAITQGIGHVLGSHCSGKLADLVLGTAAFSARSRRWSSRDWFINWANMVIPNASSAHTAADDVSTHVRRAFASVCRSTCVSFVPRAAYDAGIREKL